MPAGDAAQGRAHRSCAANPAGRRAQAPPDASPRWPGCGARSLPGEPAIEPAGTAGGCPHARIHAAAAPEPDGPLEAGHDHRGIPRSTAHRRRADRLRATATTSRRNSRGNAFGMTTSFQRGANPHRQGVNRSRGSPIHAGLCYLPVTVGAGVGAGVATKAIPKIGTRPLIVTGALLGAAGVFLLSRIPLHGTYLPDILPGIVIMGAGVGLVLVGVQNAANGGVPADKAGLAASLITRPSNSAAGWGSRSSSRSPPSAPTIYSRRTPTHPRRSRLASSEDCSAPASHS
jgi:hypothetical protein